MSYVSDRIRKQDFIRYCRNCEQSRKFRPHITETRSDKPHFRWVDIYVQFTLHCPTCGYEAPESHSEHGRESYGPTD